MSEASKVKPLIEQVARLINPEAFLILDKRAQNNNPRELSKIMCDLEMEKARQILDLVHAEYTNLSTDSRIVAAWWDGVSKRVDRDEDVLARLPEPLTCAIEEMKTIINKQS